MRRDGKLEDSFTCAGGSVWKEKASAAWNECSGSCFDIHITCFAFAAMAGRTLLAGVGAGAGVRW